MKVSDIIRILVVDDHPVVRAGLRSLLGTTPWIEVVGEAATGAETLALARRLQPALVLLDLRLPDISGLEVCRQLKESSPAPAVVFLTSYAEDASVIAAITAGADGYLLKDVDGSDLPGALRRVADGGTALDPVSARALAAAVRQPAAATVNRPGESLSGQEKKVLNLVAEGRTNKQVADTLMLTEGTVKNYLATIFGKLGVKNRTEAVVLWLKMSSESPTKPGPRPT
jgi:two-component system, NarL family, response regulator DevR